MITYIPSTLNYVMYSILILEIPVEDSSNGHNKRDLHRYKGSSGLFGWAVQDKRSQDKRQSLITRSDSLS